MTHASASAGRIPSEQLFRNEFAMVRVQRVEDPGGARLLIEDLASGEEVLLDALELEALTRTRHVDFAPLLDPSDATSEGEPDPDQV